MKRTIRRLSARLSAPVKTHEKAMGVGCLILVVIVVVLLVKSFIESMSMWA